MASVGTRLLETVFPRLASMPNGRHSSRKEPPVFTAGNGDLRIPCFKRPPSTDDFVDFALASPGGLAGVRKRPLFNGELRAFRENCSGELVRKRKAGCHYPGNRMDWNKTVSFFVKKAKK